MMIKYDDYRHIRVHFYFFMLFIVLLPISTGLAGIIGESSIQNYVLVAYVLLSVLSRFRDSIIISKDHLFIYLFIFYTIISFLWNNEFVINWYTVTFIMNATLIMCAITDRYNEVEIRYLKYSVSLSMIVVCIVTLVNLDLEATKRLNIVITSSMDPNDFAYGLLIIITFFLSCLLKRKYIIFSVAVLIVCLGIILLTGSRGAMLAYTGVLGVWFLYVYRERKRVVEIIIILAIFSIAAIVIYQFLPQYLMDRVSIVNLINDQGAGRLSIWKAAFITYRDSSIEHMIFGHGYGSFQSVVNYIAPGHDYAYQAHNMWINELIEGGVCGVLIIISMFIRTYLVAKKNENYWGCLALVGLVIAGCTLDMQSYRLLAVVFIIAIIIENESNLNNCKIRNQKIDASIDDKLW